MSNCDLDNPKNKCEQCSNIGTHYKNLKHMIGSASYLYCDTHIKELNKAEHKMY